MVRTIEIRRHSLTKKGEERGRGSHLSMAGVALARELGAKMGPFDLVVTSPGARAVETAIAMGFAVDELVETLGDIPEAVVEEIGHHDRWTWDEPFSVFAEVVARGGPTARLGERQRTAWERALEAVPSEGRVLVISHGRVIEPGLVTCCPDNAFGSWGVLFRHCEGARMDYVDGRFQNVRILRVDS